MQKPAKFYCAVCDGFSNHEAFCDAPGCPSSTDPIDVAANAANQTATMQRAYDLAEGGNRHQRRVDRAKKRREAKAKR